MSFFESWNLINYEHLDKTEDLRPTCNELPQKSNKLYKLQCRLLAKVCGKKIRDS